MIPEIITNSIQEFPAEMQRGMAREMSTDTLLAMYQSVSANLSSSPETVLILLEEIASRINEDLK